MSETRADFTEVATFQLTATSHFLKGKGRSCVPSISMSKASQMWAAEQKQSLKQTNLFSRHPSLDFNAFCHSRHGTCHFNEHILPYTAQSITCFILLRASDPLPCLCLLGSSILSSSHHFIGFPMFLSALLEGRSPTDNLALLQLMTSHNNQLMEVGGMFMAVSCQIRLPRRDSSLLLGGSWAQNLLFNSKPLQQSIQYLETVQSIIWLTTIIRHRLKACLY